MPEESPPSFEQALTQLERIVGDLERGEPALSVALAKYENGVKLLRHCYQLLDQAEQSVALLTGVDEQGNPLTIPFDAAASLAREPGSPTPTVAPDSTLQPPRRSSPSESPTQGREDPSDSQDPPF